jgi:hypothetical protein
MNTKNNTQETKNGISGKSFRWIFFAVFIFLFLIDFVIEPVTSFYLKSIFLSLYMVGEIYNFRKRFPDNWLLSPAVLASILTFIIGFGLTNYIYIVPDSLPSREMIYKLGSDPFPIFIYTLNVTILAAFAMWFGYDSSLGKKLYNLLTSAININRYFRLEYLINFPLIITLIILSVVARLYGIYIGSFGFGVTPEQITENAQIAFFLYLLGSLGKYALLVISLSYFLKPANKRIKILFVSLVITELLFGLMSGMKSAVILPFVIPFLTFYIVKKKVHKSFLIASVVFLIIAYAVIEPYRVLRSYSLNDDNSPAQIMSELIEAYKINQQYSLTNELDSDIFIVSIAARNNYLLVAARAIEYDQKTGLKTDDPDFLMKLITVPVSAFIPRALWSDKPVEDMAKWFSVYVWGGTAETSVAMTAIGFLNFAGGPFLIFVVFYIFGIMQLTLFQFFAKGSGGKIVYFGLLSSLVFIDSTVNGIFVDWIRMYPMLVVLQYFTFRK